MTLPDCPPILGGSNKGENAMVRSIASTTRERADLYATRRMVVEILRYLNSGAIETIRSATKSGVIKMLDDDVIVGESEVRQAYEMLLDEASSHRL
jgi:hypothetical protein